MATPLTILHVDPEKSWGGGQQQLVDLCRYLAQQGHRQLVACRPDGQLRPVLDELGIAVQPLVIRNDIDLVAAWHLRGVLQRYAFDIVHFHTARAHALAPFLPRRGSRFVATRLMDYPPHFRPRVQLLYNWSVDGVIAISEAIANVLVQAGVDARRLRVIHLGIDCDRFARSVGHREAARQGWAVRPDEIVLFTAAVLEPRKGHHVLLAAFAELVAAGLPLRWVICGDGTLRAQLEQDVRRRGVGDKVVFCGFSAAVERLLPGADVFVLPSLHEGLGIAAIEAMAVGLPVVASRVGGLPEIVTHGETGLLVPAGDAAALAAAIREVIADPDRARSMARRGRTRAFARFTTTQMATAVERFYYEMHPPAAEGA